MKEIESPSQEGKKKEYFFNKKNIIGFLRFLLYIVLVLGLGLLAINQGIGYFYKSRFLQTPCELCRELNPINQTSYNPILINVSLMPEVSLDTS